MNKNIIQQRKMAVRADFLDRRHLLTEDFAGKSSLQIARKLVKLQVIKNAKKILIYLPIKKEVDLRGFIESNRKKIYLPRFDEEWTIVEFLGRDKLEHGKYGIQQPIKYVEIDANRLDIAIIPGVAFSLDGTRLGFGKGVYDKLLAGVDIYKIGVAYDFQITDFVREEHDLKMDLVITEKREIKVT